MSVSVGQVSVRYDAADFRSLYGACRPCRRNLILLSFAPLAFLFFDITGGAWGIALVPPVVSYLVIGVSIAVAFYFVVPYVQVWRRSRGPWATPVEVSLTDKGIATRHPAQDSQFHWSAIKDVTERKGRLFLFTTSTCAIILPRRVFPSDEQYAAWYQQAVASWQAALNAA